MGNLKEIIVFLLSFISLRQYAGGIHLEKTEQCMIASGFLVCIAGEYLSKFSMPTVVIFWLWIVAVGCIWILAPVGCNNKKLDEIEQRVYRKCSRILLVNECFLIFIMFVAKHLWISKGIMLAQIILSINLILGWLKENFFTQRLVKTN